MFVLYFMPNCPLVQSFHSPPKWGGLPNPPEAHETVYNCILVINFKISRVYLQKPVGLGPQKCWGNQRVLTLGFVDYNKYVE